LSTVNPHESCYMRPRGVDGWFERGFEAEGSALLELTWAKLEILYINQSIRHDLFHCPPHGGAIIQSALHRPSQWVVHLTQTTRRSRTPYHQFFGSPLLAAWVKAVYLIPLVWYFILPWGLWIWGLFCVTTLKITNRWIFMPTRVIEIAAKALHNLFLSLNEWDSIFKVKVFSHSILLGHLKYQIIY